MGEVKATGTAPPTGDALVHLAYLSTQTQRMSTGELISLLAQARSANAERDITGLLLHRNDHFFQVIEGPAEAIARTFADIERDDRHHNIEVLFHEPIETREFGDWRMGFLDLDAVDVSLLKGYSDFLERWQEPRALLTSLSSGERLALLFQKLSN